MQLIRHWASLSIAGAGLSIAILQVHATRDQVIARVPSREPSAKNVAERSGWPTLQQTPCLGSRVAACFAGPPTLLPAITAGRGVGNDFDLTNRWSQTALTPGPLAQGDPTTITYGFAPDGTVIVPSSWGGMGANALFATFDAAFGCRTTWQNLVHEAFARWAALSGITFQYEPADDRVPVGSPALGVPNVRGDIRIAANAIDGASGVNLLAYNYFPDNGDMVIDTDNATQFAANHRLFRNLLMHEIGHAIGIKHVCPINSTKLMEAFIATGFDGPQLDDQLAAQRHYGDRFEPNDSLASAPSLGTVMGSVRLDMLSIDGAGDVDHFRFHAPGNMLVTVRVEPASIDMPYMQGPETSTSPPTCGTVSSYEPWNRRDLAITVLDASGNTPLAVSATEIQGAPETANLISPPGGAAYRIQVSGVDTSDDIQMYHLRVATYPLAQFHCNPANGHRYTLTSQPSDVFAARIEAQELGGYLVAINDPAENAFLERTFGPIAQNRDQWIGLSDEVNEGQWRWDSGEPVTYFNWESGQPDNSNGREDYVIMRTWSGGRWNDYYGSPSIWPGAALWQGIVEIPLTSSFILDQPYGPGSLRLATFNYCTPNAVAVRPITFVRGVFPRGWAFGVDISWGDFLNQLLWGPPFVVTLDNQGTNIWEIPAGVPPGITLFAGCGLFAPGNGTFLGQLVPVTLTTR